jgi:5,5'-dehydrodivanillate O-demethylase oxygenase subunit
VETKEMNERLTQVGPGTPMGKLLRHYWWPIAGSAELLDNPVKPIRLLGEHLTLYKDRQGRLGLLAERCGHRRLNLEYGIPEQDGLRCPYHGWMYDQTGQCIDQPAEAPGDVFKERVKILAYPVQELGGLIFAYLGPQPAPLLPRWDLYAMENSIRTIAVEEIPCNWLQCMENSVDTVHTEWLHGHLHDYALERQGKPVPKNHFLAHHEKIAFEKHEIGIVKKRLRKGLPEDNFEWKYGHLLVFPMKVRLGSYGRSESFQIRVPMDDTHTWHICYDVYSPPDVELPKQEVIPVFRSPMKDDQGRPVIDYVLGQDMVAWYGQGPVVEREEERLAATDRGLVMFRTMLKEQMKIVEQGGDPMNVFRDPAENEYLSTVLYDEPEESGRWSGRVDMSGNYGKFNPQIREMEAYLQQVIDSAREKTPVA